METTEELDFSFVYISDEIDTDTQDPLKNSLFSTGFIDPFWDIESSSEELQD